MWLNKPNTQIAIGLLVLCLVLTITMRRTSGIEFLGLMRELQLTATLALFFGIFKAHCKHRANCLLLWLVLTAFSGLLMLKAGCIYSSDDVIGSIVGVLLSWTFAVALGYLWTIMYNGYVELTVGANEKVDEAVNAVQVEPDVEKTPAPYPNLDNLTVLVHGKRLQEK